MDAQTPATEMTVEPCKFWFVWTKSGNPPQCAHGSYRSAVREARRLARKCPGLKFIVLEALKKYHVASNADETSVPSPPEPADSGGPRRPGHYDGIGESFEEVDAPDFSEVDDVVGETAIATAPEVIEAAPEPPPGTPPCPFPLLSDIKDGDMLIADDAFTCLDEDEVLEVRSDEKGELYVPCDDGKHYLEGQRGHGEWALDRCVGLRRAPEEPKPALVETDDEIMF